MLYGSVFNLFTELKELTSSLTTGELVSEIQELKTECAEYRARLEAIMSATNHVTPEEREKVGDTCNQSYYKHVISCSIYCLHILNCRCTKNGRYM